MFRLLVKHSRVWCGPETNRCSDLNFGISIDLLPNCGDAEVVSDVLISRIPGATLGFGTFALSLW